MTKGQFLKHDLHTDPRIQDLLDLAEYAEGRGDDDEAACARAEIAAIQRAALPLVVQLPIAFKGLL
jgi:hypothetical protein